MKQKSDPSPNWGSSTKLLYFSLAFQLGLADADVHWHALHAAHTDLVFSFGEAYNWPRSRGTAFQQNCSGSTKATRQHTGSKPSRHFPETSEIVSGFYYTARVYLASTRIIFFYLTVPVPNIHPPSPRNLGSWKQVCLGKPCYRNHAYNASKSPKQSFIFHRAPLA